MTAQTSPATVTSSKRTDGTCMYNGACRNVNVVYELKDKVTGMAYVGKTQNDLKSN